MIHGIPFPNLLEEFKEEAKRIHAITVYHKCIKNGKLHWAYKIARKYDVREHINDDRTIAFGWALKASIKK